MTETVCSVGGQCILVARGRDLIVFPVRTVEFKDTVLKSCSYRVDGWASTVQARVLHVHDLHAADTVYHQVCIVNF